MGLDFRSSQGTPSQYTDILVRMVDRNRIGRLNVHLTPAHKNDLTQPTVIIKIAGSYTQKRSILTCEMLRKTRAAGIQDENTVR